jgi:hypothetical protein
MRLRSRLRSSPKNRVYGDRADAAPSVEAAIKAKGGSSEVIALRRKRAKRPPAAAGPGAKKSLAPGSAVITFAACDGWAKLQVHLAAIAYNVKRYWRLQSA